MGNYFSSTRIIDGLQLPPNPISIDHKATLYTNINHNHQPMKISFNEILPKTGTSSGDINLSYEDVDWLSRHSFSLRTSTVNNYSNELIHGHKKDDYALYLSSAYNLLVYNDPTRFKPYVDTSEDYFFYDKKIRSILNEQDKIWLTNQYEQSVKHYLFKQPSTEAALCHPYSNNSGLILSVHPSSTPYHTNSYYGLGKIDGKNYAPIAGFTYKNLLDEYNKCVAPYYKIGGLVERNEKTTYCVEQLDHGMWSGFVALVRYARQNIHPIDNNEDKSNNIK